MGLIHMRDVAGVFRWVCCIALCAMGGLPPLVQAADPPASEKSVIAEAELAPEVQEALDHLEPLWESMSADVVSYEVRYRKFFRVVPISPRTRDQVLELRQRYALGEHPERAPEFLRDVAGQEARVEVPTRQVFMQGPYRRQSLGPLAYVDDANFSFVHDGDNKQVHVYERGRSPVGIAGLELFRTPMPSRAGGYRPDRLEREAGLLRLISITPSTSQMGELLTTNTIDWATGVVLHRLREQYAEVTQEVDYSGLTTFAGGITIPRCVVIARYAKGFLESLDLALLDDARLNETIPESMFVVSVPRGWHVLDFREQASGTGIATPPGEVDDVRTLIPTFALNPPGQSLARNPGATPPSFTKQMLLVLNGLALIALGVWMWKRASLKEPNH